MILRALGTHVVACALLASAAAAQPLAPPSAPSGDKPVTLLSRPADVQFSFDGRMKFHGTAPLELPSSLVGRYSVQAGGNGVARTQGVLHIPPMGASPRLVSEPPGMSAGLLVRSLNYPGLPDISSRRTARGLLLAAAATGAAVTSVQNHFQYRDRLDEFGPYAADRALDERRARDSWLVFGGAVWAASAVDYLIRPRMDLVESTPERLTISVPAASRGGALWRSLLVPGAGQEFANRRARGSIWLGAALAAGAGVVVANTLVERKQTDADFFEAYMDSAGPSELPVLARALEVARNDLQEAEDARRTFGIALLSVWVANLIDAAVMPITTAPASKPKVEASIPLRPGMTAVALRYRF